MTSLWHRVLIEQRAVHSTLLLVQINVAVFCCIHYRQSRESSLWCTADTVIELLYKAFDELPSLISSIFDCINNQLHCLMQSVCEKRAKWRYMQRPVEF